MISKFGFVFIVFALLQACATSAPQKSVSSKNLVESTFEPHVSLATLQQSDMAGLDQLLGAPIVTRREGRGQYRLYQHGPCNIVVVLFPDETGAHRVRHVETTSPNTSEETPPLSACLT